MTIVDRTIGTGTYRSDRFQSPVVTRRIAGAVCRRLHLGQRPRIAADLSDGAPVVADQPFLDDAVFPAGAVGDRGNADPTPCRGTEHHVVAHVRHLAGDPVRAVQTAVGIGAPDHVLADYLAIARHRQGADRALYDGLGPYRRPGERVHDAVVAVVRPAQADVLLLPDAVRTADNIVDKIAVDGIEAGQLLPARAELEQLSKRPSDRRAHLGQVVPLRHAR